MKKVLLATTALAIVAASASAVDVEMYGQVNKGMFAYDDGRDTNSVIVDNHKSESRFGLKGAQALDNGLTASFLLESAIASNPSNGFTQTADTAGTSGQPAINAGGANNSGFAERQARVGLSGAWGGVYLGHQSTAIDSVRDQDLVGVRDVMGASYASDFGSALDFRSNTGTLTNTIASAGAPDVQDRAQSVRYDSPIFAGFQGRANYAENGNVAASAFYDGALAGFKVKGALGYESVQDRAGLVPAGTTANAVDSRTDASLSIAHASGLAATVGYNREGVTNKTNNQDTPTSWYGKVGYAWDAYEVAADYGQSQHYSSTNGTGITATDDDKLKSFGLGAQYNMGQGVSLAALYRNFSADRTGTDLKDINLYGVNMRVKF